MSFLDDAWKGVKKVVRSPVTKVAAGGLAIVFPAVGVPAVAGLAIASKTMDNVDAATAKKTKAAAVKHATAAKVTLARASKATGDDRTKLLAKAREHAASAKALGKKSKRIAHARSNLAAKLVQTRKLAAAGDHGAQRALATFQLVKQARAGNPKALAQAKLLRQRHDVGQAIQKHFQLHANGRVVYRGKGRLGTDDPAILPLALPPLGTDWFANVRVGDRRFEGHGTLAGDRPAWVRDPVIWHRAEGAVMPHAHRYRDPWAVVATVYKRMGGRVG